MNVNLIHAKTEENVSTLLDHIIADVLVVLLEKIVKVRAEQNKSVVDVDTKLVYPALLSSKTTYCIFSN